MKTLKAPPASACSEPLHNILSDKYAEDIVGPEVLVRTDPDGVSLFRAKNGQSYRYVYCENGFAIGGLQVVTNNDRDAGIAVVYVRAEYRRRGIATRLLQTARRDFATVAHSSHLSDDAKKWVEVVG